MLARLSYQPTNPNEVVMNIINHDHRFYTFHNRSAFLHAEYCHPGTDPTFKKIKLWAGKTQDGKTVQDASHYFEFQDMRYLSFIILRGMEPGPQEAYTSIRGVLTKGTPVCRVMKLRRGSLADKAKGTRDESHKYFLSIGIGPGQETNGVVMPSRKAPKEAWTYTTLVYSEQEIQTFALHMQAWVNGIVIAEVKDVLTQFEEATNYDE